MSQQNASKRDFESKYTRVTFTEQEISKMKTPHAVMNSQKGWKRDRERTQEIDYMMKPYFGNEETEIAKQKFVSELQEIVTQWSTQLAQQILAISAEESKQYQAKLLTFGSSILGVSSKKGDIDMVCTCPNFIRRNPHFEEELCMILQNNEHVKSLSNIRTAKVPIITFQYKEQDIDISFAQLQLPQLPPTIEDYVSDDLLINMEERDILSLSGRRCNQAIVRSVPNLRNFQIACRFIKLWAQAKGIYENSIGFLGGISWAILVAKICQMFPNYEANQLLEEFFYYYSSWDFTMVHVLLNDYYNQRTPKQRAISLYMNVMTACFPEYNSTERVKEITLYIIKQRLNEANEIIQKEIKFQYKHYKDLLENYDFVNKYQVFIEYSLQYPEKISSQTTDKEFEDFMNSSKVKILSLIQRLSESRLKGVEFCPWPQFFTKTQVSYKKIQVLYIGINDNNDERNYDLEKECKLQIQSFYQFIKNDQKYSGYLEKFDVGMDWISNKEIVKKTFKITQQTYDITQPLEDQERPDISKYENNLQKKTKLNKNLTNEKQNNGTHSTHNGDADGVSDNEKKEEITNQELNQQNPADLTEGNDEEQQDEEDDDNCDINDFY